MQKSQGKIDFFTHFLSHLPGVLSFYTPLEHTKIFGVGLGGSSAGLGGYFRFWGDWGLYKPLLFVRKFRKNAVFKKQISIFRVLGKIGLIIYAEAIMARKICKTFIENHHENLENISNFQKFDGFFHKFQNHENNQKILNSWIRGSDILLSFHKFSHCLLNGSSKCEGPAY